MESYKTLEKIFYKINDLRQTQAVLHWDTATIMPVGGADARSEQLATIESIQHALITDESINELILDAESKLDSLNPWQKSNVIEMRRRWKHASAVPQKLLKEFVKAGSKCEMVWRSAKVDNDFKQLVPALKKVVNLVREIATIKSKTFGCDQYTALLDQYDPGRTTQDLELVFEDLKQFVPGFIAEVIEKQKSRSQLLPLQGNFPMEKQKRLAKEIMKILGFNFNYGRLDESRHPFCGGYPSDIRITTRYDESNLIPGMMGIFHETGHALYEDGLPRSLRGQPVGEARGMSVHESQSLFMEMQVCRSRSFLKYFLPMVKQEFNVDGAQWEVDNVYNSVTKVQPSFIRVDADEVTYPAHILLRYYMEKYLVSGEMEVEDLPDAWDQGMERFLGIRPSSDKEGCMQDIHWMDGTFGYFPSYTIGAIYAAQIAKAIKADKPNFYSDIEQGKFSVIKKWLGVNIHENGSKFSTSELIKQATGSELDITAYKDHLKHRYLDEQEG